MPCPHHTWTDTYLKKQGSAFCILCINYSFQGAFSSPTFGSFPVCLSNRKYPSEPGSLRTQTMNSYCFPAFIKNSFNFTSYLLIYQIQLTFHFLFNIIIFPGPKSYLLFSYICNKPEFNALPTIFILYSKLSLKPKTQF